MQNSFLYGKSVTTPGGPLPCSKLVPVLSVCGTLEYKRFQRPPSVYTSKSAAAEVTLPADTLGGKSIKIFRKRSQHSQQGAEEQ